MKRSIVGMMVLLVVCQSMNGPVLGASFSTGIIWFTQLDGTKFLGEAAGDEFETMFRTADNHTFLSLGSSGGPPYEYALPGADGDFISSGVQVGIGAPPPKYWAVLEVKNATESVLR